MATSLLNAPGNAIAVQKLERFQSFEGKQFESSGALFCCSIELLLMNNTSLNHFLLVVQLLTCG